MPVNPLKTVLPVVFLALPALGLAQQAETVAAPTEPAAAQMPAPDGVRIVESATFDLDAHMWIDRVLAVFADTPADPAYIRQMQLIHERPRDLVERDVIVVTDTDPDVRSDLRTTLRPRGFALVLIDKDGVIKLRKPAPWSTREISRSIDKTELRRQEIRESNISAPEG